MVFLFLCCSIELFYRMLGKRSLSGVAGKRRRGPPQRPRGDPTTQQYTLDFRKTKIRYQTPEVIPRGRSTRIRDSPLLQFELDASEYQRLGELIQVNLLSFRRIDWELLDRIGQRDRIEFLLGDKFRVVLDCDAHQYKELTLEFYATFQYKQGNYGQYHAFSFSLGRKVYEMTMPQFAVVTQLYTQE
ncbi:hypothetical protein HanPI659440_Chr07g0256321 [Helianthus annuus]|nr:hypothetical protein HanPI659440_Chr07g0256321 [Helianthus annuus]